MQRLHEDDLAGYLMQQEGWEILSLPAISEVDELIPIGHGNSSRGVPARYCIPNGNRCRRCWKPKMPWEQWISQRSISRPVPEHGNLIHWPWFLNWMLRSKCGPSPTIGS